jgi:hypothetical protein
MTKGNYEITVYNSNGRKLVSRKLQHGGGNATYSLPLDALWAGDVYRVSIIREDSKKLLTLTW